MGIEYRMNQCFDANCNPCNTCLSLSINDTKVQCDYEGDYSMKTIGTVSSGIRLKLKL